MVVRPHDLEDMRVLAAQVLAEIPASAYRRESVQTTSQTSHPPPPGISAIGSVDSHSSRRRTRRRRPRRRRTRHSRTRRRRTLRRRRRRRACTRRNSSRSSCARSTRARLLSGRPSVNRRRRRRRSMTATASCRPPLPARRRQPGRTTRTAAGWTATSRRCRHGRRRLHGRRRRHRAAPPSRRSMLRPRTRRPPTTPSAPGRRCASRSSRRWTRTTGCCFRRRRRPGARATGRPARGSSRTTRRRWCVPSLLLPWLRLRLTLFPSSLRPCSRCSRCCRRSRSLPRRRPPRTPGVMQDVEYSDYLEEEQDMDEPDAPPPEGDLHGEGASFSPLLLLAPRSSWLTRNMPPPCASLCRRQRRRDWRDDDGARGDVRVVRRGNGQVGGAGRGGGGAFPHLLPLPRRRALTDTPRPFRSPGGPAPEVEGAPARALEGEDPC